MEIHDLPQNIATPTVVLAVAAHGSLAVLGAIAHAIDAHRKGESKTLWDFTLLTVMSSFSGVIFALVALYLFDNQYITLACAGSGGFLGVEGLTLLTNKIKDVVIRTFGGKE